MPFVKGTAATKDFYDRIGWQRQDGVLIDHTLFAVRNPGPVLRSLIAHRQATIRACLGGHRLHLAEFGCGGSPATFLANSCRRYTAVDFSAAGLAEAARSLQATGVTYETVKADMTDLPMADGSFDVAYSAQAIYHIANADAQAAAFSEIMRVVRPGGRALFVLVNPFPVLFPWRALRRMLAMTPVINTLLNKLRAKPPLPYLPMPLGWMRRKLQRSGRVTIVTYAIPSFWFDQHVSETSPLTGWMWRTARWIETNWPRLSARLGCYVLIVVEKS
jgi:ubiquinone/menaquinone biosynthesis C-methylase UbiE